MDKNVRMVKSERGHDMLYVHLHHLNKRAMEKSYWECSARQHWVKSEITYCKGKGKHIDGEQADQSLDKVGSHTPIYARFCMLKKFIKSDFPRSEN